MNGEKEQGKNKKKGTILSMHDVSVALLNTKIIFYGMGAQESAQLMPRSRAGPVNGDNLPDNGHCVHSLFLQGAFLQSPSFM